MLEGLLEDACELNPDQQLRRDGVFGRRPVNQRARKEIPVALVPTCRQLVLCLPVSRFARTGTSLVVRV